MHAALFAGKSLGRQPQANPTLTKGTWGWTPQGCFVHTNNAEPKIIPHFSSGTGKTPNCVLSA